ncbi:aromatic alcohol reductase [Aspergillus aculeatinus CBS 121060]|uniref:Isoflavone reductase family protein CipA n=1 Tax=Aspergillus aculeatinus CBS 121060 TaxID=1448322 RepID=A0ACD1H166_9EURO|nr:putative isoflavone reductase family protein CipA [Aspergillus aculeatinus CBS 121060]RAH67143.1 putative isoflavone reductase family protein CipA [Aspergillus aculeatinus CBS 121060]
MSSIKNVALAGASGNVGSQVLHALLAQNFTVTILTRKPATATTFPAAATVKQVDFASPASLTAALAGQDAVIDTTFSPDIDTPLRLIDAAAAAGVSRFITSDFGLDPTNPGIHALPVFARKKAAYEAVQRHAAASTLTYTVVACGVFLDWALRSGFAGLDFPCRKVRIFGTGDNVVPWTTLEDVGRATAAVLLHPQETRNRAVYVHSVYLSQSQLVGVVKKVLGAKGWEETRERDMRGLVEGALVDLREGREVTAATFEVQIQYCIATRELAYPWERDDNGLLGVRELGVEEVEGLVQRVAGGV